MQTVKGDDYWVVEMCAVIDAADQIVKRGEDTFSTARTRWSSAPPEWL